MIKHQIMSITIFKKGDTVAGKGQVIFNSDAG